MGIPGLFDHVGKLERVSLAKLAADHFKKHSRKLRIAIDASIWLFQARDVRGGSNPVLRTLYFRLLRLLKLGVDPVLVFDGAGRPNSKRNKKINRSWEPRYAQQLRQMIDLFGFVHHNAPGEAEAECASLQRAGCVDMVFSEDGDTLMFGATVMIRNWSSQEKRGSKVPTHVDILYAETIKEQQRLSREGMILIALMSGGDYDTTGIKRCGSVIAYEAAKAGFGDDLLVQDSAGAFEMDEWRERLKFELQTNESGFFGRKQPKLAESISSDFPCPTTVRSYLTPLVSSPSDLLDLKESLQSDRSVDIFGLRNFLGDKLEWNTRAGALKYIRGLAPGMLTSQLLSRHSTPEGPAGLLSICGARTHVSSDGIPETRVEIMPIDLVPLDLDSEPLVRPAKKGATSSQMELPPENDGNEDEDQQDMEEDDGDSASTEKRRQYRPYDPDAPEKLFVPEYYIHHGAMSRLSDWQRASQLPKPKSPRKPRAKKAATGTGMKEGSIESFFSVSKGPFSRSSQTTLPKPDMFKLTAATKRAKTTSQSITKANPSVNPWTMAKEVSASTIQSRSQPSYNFQTPRSRSTISTFPASHASSVINEPSSSSDPSFNVSRMPEEDLIVIDDDDVYDAVGPKPVAITNTLTSITSSHSSCPQDFTFIGEEILNHETPKNPSVEKLKSRIRDSLPGSWAVVTPGGNRHASARLLEDEIVDLT